MPRSAGAALTTNAGAKPYQTVIDLNEPAFKCSCPSRKFPCKHAVGLFLLVANEPATADLYEGGNAEEFLKRAAALVSSGVQLITLLALDDKGAPGFNQSLATKLSAFGVPCFACSPDVFPDLMAATIERRDIMQWAAERSIVVAR